MSKIKILNETLEAVNTSKKAGEYTDLASGKLSQEETIALVQSEALDGAKAGVVTNQFPDASDQIGAVHGVKDLCEDVPVLSQSFSEVASPTDFIGFRLKKMLVLLAGLTILFFAAYNFLDEEPGVKLSIGDRAPQLLISEWINGDAVDQFKPGHIYVVEFWATWCGPCRDSIPHLSQLNTKFKDRGVTFIGVNTLENDASLVAPFIKEMGEEMNYRVAIDQTGGRRDKSYNLWMSHQEGLPMVFVVDRQAQIAWIGHPMGKVDEVLEKLVAGTFDIKKEAELAQQEEVLLQDFYDAGKVSNFNKMRTLVEELLTINPKSGALLSSSLFCYMLEGKQYDKAYAYLTEITPFIESDAKALNQVAWMILTGEEIEKRDLASALTLSLKSNEIAQYKKAQYLNTLARAYFDQGEVSKAIEFQTLVLKKLSKSEESMRSELKQKLEEYKASL